MTEAVKFSPATLSAIEVFSDLPLADYESLSRIVKTHIYQTDEQLITLGDQTQDVFFIISGKVRITTFTTCGKEVTFQDLSAGKMFGELSAIDGQERSTNAVALSESVIAVASAKAFFQILNDYPKVNERILKQLSGLIRKLSDRIIEFSALSVKSRVHAEILRLAKNNILDNNTAEISPAPTHLDIANRISTHREAVSREISELNKSGILKKATGKLIVQDVAKLESLLES